MGAQIHTSNPNKQKYTPQYLNWFDQRKSEYSRFGSGWMDRVEGQKIADGIFRLIPDIEKGKIGFDMYKEAFDSANFTTNAVPALDGKAREISIILSAIDLAFKSNSIALNDMTMINHRRSLLELELTEYNVISNALKAYAMNHLRVDIERMFDEVLVIGKRRRLLEDTEKLNRYNSSGMPWSQYEDVSKKRADASRTVSRFTRTNFNVSDFVKELKKDITIIPYIVEDCNDNIKFIGYVQSGILSALDEISKTYYNMLNRKKTAYEMILNEFNTAQSLLNTAHISYTMTGVYVFPATIEYNLLALQSKLVNSYKNIL